MALLERETVEAIREVANAYTSAERKRLGKPDDQASTILAVTSRRFLWTKTDGFVFRPGSEETEGLNRTHAGALARIASNRTSRDTRQREFLATLLGEEAVSMIASATIQHRNGEHLVEGRMYGIGIADISD